MTKRIFISYRRDDSAGHAGRVFDRLRADFGQDVLFMDVDAIPLGANFVRVLREEVAKCDVLLAIIGPAWLGAKDEAGGRRLDNPTDFVRIEIAAALARDIPVIPILLEGTRMPNAGGLPADLAALSERNGLDVRHASFHADMDKLVTQLTPQILTWEDRHKRTLRIAEEMIRDSRPNIRSPKRAAPSPSKVNEVIASNGLWMMPSKKSLKAGDQPINFPHFFIRVVVAESSVPSTAGTIVKGFQWDNSEMPLWTVAHGHWNSKGSTGPDYSRWLTYLGPTWRPEYAALSEAVFKKLGGKWLARFITHP